MWECLKEQSLACALIAGLIVGRVIYTSDEQSPAHAMPAHAPVEIQAGPDFPSDPPRWQLPRELQPLTADNCVALLTAGLTSDLGVPGIIRDCRQSGEMERLALVQEWLRQRNMTGSTVICLAPITVSAELPPPPADKPIPWGRLALGLIVTLGLIWAWRNISRPLITPL